MATKKAEQPAEAPEPTVSEPAGFSFPPLGTMALAFLRSKLEDEAPAAVDYGISAAVIGAKKLGWSYDELVEQLKGFWDHEERLKL